MSERTILPRLENQPSFQSDESYQWPTEYFADESEAVKAYQRRLYNAEARLRSVAGQLSGLRSYLRNGLRDGSKRGVESYSLEDYGTLFGTIRGALHWLDTIDRLNHLDDYRVSPVTGERYGD